MIKAVLFDIGGVLARFNRSTGSRPWEERLGLAPGTLANTIYQSVVSRLGFVGRAPEEAVWEDFARRMHLSMAEVEQLKQDFWSDRDWDRPLLDFIRDLRPRYRTGVVSDALSGVRDEVRPWVNESLFDVIVTSAEAGVLKPDARIFDLALTALGVQRDEAIFVDDTPRIIIGARALGMHAVRFVTHEQTVADIKRLLAA